MAENVNQDDKKVKVNEKADNGPDENLAQEAVEAAKKAPAPEADTTLAEADQDKPKKAEKVKTEKAVDPSQLSAKAQAVLGKIEAMTVLELNQLVKVLEEKFGVSAAVSVAGPAPAANGGADGRAEVEEKTAYDVILAEVGSEKVKVIKAVREINQNLGLMEAKTLVESAPKPVLEGAKKEDAQAAQKKLLEAGAKVELK